jgi:hypothetical protein
LFLEEKMKKRITGIMAALMLFTVAPLSSMASAPVSSCSDADTSCKQFEAFTQEEQPEKVIAQYNPARHYSDDALRYVGDAYLALASRDNITPEQEESYYWKALKVKQATAYMGLYFLYARKDEKKALGFLRAYIKTKPADTFPYVILGEAELDSKNYTLSAAYLREANKVAHAHSPHVDWLLFQASYLLKDYAVAGELFESAVTNGKFEKELKALVSDLLFADIEKRPEFKKHQDLLKAAKSSQ